LTQPTIAEAAKAARIDERTVYRYLKDPIFQAEYSAGKRQLVQEALGMAAQGATGAMAVLRVLTTDAKVPASVRVRAAVAVLDICVQQIALTDLEGRLLTLQQQVTTLVQTLEQTRAHSREV
jgi:hypothetical protein